MILRSCRIHLLSISKMTNVTKCTGYFPPPSFTEYIKSSLLSVTTEYIMNISNHAVSGILSIVVTEYNNLGRAGFNIS